MLYTVNGFAKGHKVISFNKICLNEGRLNISLNVKIVNHKIKRKMPTIPRDDIVGISYILKSMRIMR